MIRNILGWTFDQLAEKMRNAYSVEYLKGVHGGKPMPEVEEKLSELYIRGLGEKLLESMLNEQCPESLRKELLEKFLGVVRRFEMSLDGVSELYRRSLKEGIALGWRDPEALLELDLKVWEKALESIAFEVIRGPEDGVFLEEREDMHPLVRDVENEEIECSYCHKVTKNPKVCKCLSCGHTLVHPNWDR